MTEETSFTVIKVTEIAFLIYTIRLHDIVMFVCVYKYNIFTPLKYFNIIVVKKEAKIKYYMIDY